MGLGPATAMRRVALYLLAFSSLLVQQSKHNSHSVTRLNYTISGPLHLSRSGLLRFSSYGAGHEADHPPPPPK